MHIMLYPTYILLLLITAQASSLEPAVNVTENYLSAPSISNSDPAICHSSDSQHAPIHNSDCYKLENDILLDPFARIPRLWGLIGMSYPRSYQDCSLGFLQAPPSHSVDPLEKFSEYEIAIAAAVVVNNCLRHHNGGLKYITQSRQFAVDVVNPRPLGAGNTLPSTNIIEKEMINNSTLLSPLPKTPASLVTETPRISNLTATVECYPSGPRAQYIDRQDCYELFHQMLLRPDLLIPQTWTGRLPPDSQGPWTLGSCGFGVIGRSSLGSAYFKLIDPLIAAAMIVQTCFVDEGLSAGGLVRIPDQRFFSVRLWKPNTLAENMTLVESA